MDAVLYTCPGWPGSDQPLGYHTGSSGPTSQKSAAAGARRKAESHHGISNNKANQPMTTYVDEKRRRIEQFTQYLRLMGLRRHKIVKKMTVSSSSRNRPPKVPTHPSSRNRLPSSSVAGKTAAKGRGGEDSEELLLSDGRRDEPSRYIQIGFHRDSFFLDMSNNTLFPPEAKQILRQRPGFYYARNRRDLWWV